MLRQTLRGQLHGERSHLHILHALEGIDPALAGERISGAPHTIFQVLHHMVYWQEMALARLRGDAPTFPATDSVGWPGQERPYGKIDLEGLIERFGEGLEELDRRLKNESDDLSRIVNGETGTGWGEIAWVQGHNSYHLGQIVLLRQQLGAWPPPRGTTSW